MYQRVFMSRNSSFKMKKSFSLLISLILISIFSFLGIFIIETKSMTIENKNNLYLESQSKLHLDFFKSYIKTLDLKTECLENIELNDDIYKLSARLEYENSCLNSENNSVVIDIFINSKTKFNEVNLHERFTLEI